jgi:hypothetical protein
MRYLALIFTFFSCCSNAQILDAIQINEIGQHEFDVLDDLMVSKHKFVRVKDIEDENQKVYTNNSDHLEQLMVVTVFRNSNGCSNVLSIVDNSEENVDQLKDDLPQEGFVYHGKKKMSEELIVSQFSKGKLHVLISDTITASGAYQILLMCSN